MEEKYITPSGSEIVPVYSSKVLEDGTVELVQTGEENIYDYIQSFKDSVDIGVILKKCMNGDYSGLQRVQGFYGDVTQFPKTRQEILQTVIDAQSNFEKLPLDVKEQFDNDFNKFFVSMDKPEWYEKMKMAFDGKGDKSEVKNYESEQ